MMSPKQLAEKVQERLLQLYGRPVWRKRLPPLDELVSTILSQNTNDVNRDRAYENLRRRFPTWDAVRDGETADVVEAVRLAGLGNQKGPRIQEALRHISAERGELSLDFLRQMEVEEAKRWLTAMKGVGPKTAAIILLFALDMPAFPVDTHIHRVSKRLGLISQKVSREKAHDLLEDLMPSETYYAFHLNVIRHGREVCEARQPRCEVCVLRDLCDYYRSLVQTQLAAEEQA